VIWSGKREATAAANGEAEEGARRLLVEPAGEASLTPALSGKVALLATQRDLVEAATTEVAPAGEIPLVVPQAVAVVALATQHLLRRR
jgi:hypothetical protein